MLKLLISMIGGKPMQLLYFADAMCSWCWGFAPVIKKITKKHPDLPLEVVAGGLRPNENRAMNKEIRESLHKHWQKIAGLTQQPFVFDNHPADGFVYNTEAASRALVTMRHMQPEQQLNYLHRLQQAFYAEQQDITDRDTLLRLAAEQGAPTDFAGTFDSIALQAATARDFERRWDYQVMGFPTLILEKGDEQRVVAMGYCDYQQASDQLELAIGQLS